MGHPGYRVEGKIFATMYYPDENWGMVKLTPEHNVAPPRLAARVARK